MSKVAVLTKLKQLPAKASPENNKHYSNPGSPSELILNTKQKQLDHSEKNLAHLQQRFEAIVQNSNDAIVGLSEKLRITSWNNAAQKLFGYGENEVLDKQIDFIVPKHLRKEAKALLNEQDVINYETERIKKDGQIVQVSMTKSPIKDTDGRVVGYSIIYRDNTEKKRLEELKKEFLSLAAHELKTPITTLKLISQAHIAKYKRYGLDQIKLAELEIIDRELERLTQLINDILDDTRIEKGKLYLKFEQTNLDKLIITVIKKMTVLSHHHEIIFQRPTKKISVIIDQQRIEQVLVNLLANAMKYSNLGSKIELGAKIEKGKVLVWVRDQGLGISKSAQQRIFDRFYQVEEKESRGFGLGLYITKQIVEQHKGKIWVESVIGKGSTFYFSLPIRKF